MGSLVNLPRISRILLFGSLLIPVSVGVWYGVHRWHTPNLSTADGLLRRANDLSWANQWIEAKPLYQRAEHLLMQQHRDAEALYARVSQVPADSELGSLPVQISTLSADLALPGAQNPKTRLRILEIRGMLETNYDSGLARTTWQQVGEMAKSQHRYMLASRAIGEQGIASFLLGDFASAKKQVLTAWGVAKYLGDPAARVRYASVYGAGLVELHHYQEALGPLDEAIGVANRKSGIASPSIATIAKIEALTGLGRYQEAFALADQASVKARRYHLQAHLFELDRVRGDAYQKMGDWPRALEEYTTAVGYAKSVGYWRGETQGDGLLASAYEHEGQLPAALQSIDNAVEANKQIPDEIYFVPRDLAIKAEILAKMGQTKTSNDLYQKSADLIDSLLVNVPTPGIERDLITQLGFVYSGYFNSLCAQNRYGDAFRILEKARGRIETQALQHHEAIDPEKVTAGEHQLVLLNTQLLETDDQAKRSKLLERITDAESHLDNSSLAEKTSDDPVELPALQHDLGPSELVLEYVLADPQSYVLAVSSTTVARYPLASRQVIEAAADQYRGQLRKGQINSELAGHLFQALLGGVPDYRQKQSILVVPDGKLDLLPFSALMDGPDYVLTTHIVSTIPSSTVLHLIRNRSQSQGFVEHPYVGVAAWTKSTPSAIAEVKRAVGGPEESEFVPLPESRHEVQMVADDLPKPSTILLGGNATETRFKELPLRDYGVFHLALHGYADLHYPDRSALVFAPESNGGNDGLLQVREIRKLTLNASLVTLSACDTSLGPVGEAGVANLANAFVEAGAQTVVSALWDLEDHATARLMAQFYSRLSQGMGKAEALQQAQVELAHAGLSPYYWASFEVVGDPSGHLYSGLPVVLSSNSKSPQGRNNKQMSTHE